MEKGDITQHVTQRSVVTLLPTLVLTGITPRYSKLLSLRQRLQRRIEAAHVNTAMLAWMERTAFTHSTTFEVWHIATVNDIERRFFEIMAERCDPYIQRSVSYWEHFDEHAAVDILISSPHVSVVYDADHERVERCWPLRGQRVALGGTP